MTSGDRPEGRGMTKSRPASDGPKTEDTLSERCGYAVVDSDGIEQPCDRPVTGWRWYQDCEHEDTLDVACQLHENPGGRRMADLQARITELEAERDEWRENAKQATLLLADAMERITELETDAAKWKKIACDVDDSMIQQIERAERAEAALADLRGGATTVEIGGQVMTQAQFDAARYPLLHPDPGPVQEP